MTMILQHPNAFARFDPPAPWMVQASTPGIATPKLYICTACKIALSVRSRPVCFQCGQPMKAGK